MSHSEPERGNRSERERPDPQDWHNTEIKQLSTQLAAERDKVERLGAIASELRSGLEWAKEQLAAEREAGVKVLTERSFELHQCQQQLAAERNGRAEDFQSLSETNLQLRQQLADEREKLKAACKVSQDSQKALWEAMKCQSLLDALKDIQQGRDNPVWTPARIADRALAQWKEKKGMNGKFT